MAAMSRRRSTSTGRPPCRTKERRSVRVLASRTAGSTPVHSATATAGPNRSTACPLVLTRASGIRSTTVTAHPLRCSQYAAVGPATLAPEINTRSGPLDIIDTPPPAPRGELRLSRPHQRGLFLAADGL